MILRPLAALILFGLICLPVRLAVQKWLPPGRLRSLLLFQLKRSTGGESRK